MRVGETLDVSRGISLMAVSMQDTVTVVLFNSVWLFCRCDYTERSERQEVYRRSRVPESARPGQEED